MTATLQPNLIYLFPRFESSENMIDRFIAEYFRLELHDFFDESIDDIYEQYTSVKNQNLEEKTKLKLSYHDILLSSYKGEVTQDITTRISDLSWYLIIKKENLSLTAPRLLSKELLFSRFIKKFNLCRNNFDNSRFRRTKTLEESPIMDSIIEFKHLHAKTKMVKELLVKYRCKFKETNAVMSELFDLCLNDIKKVEPIVRRAHWASSLSIIVHSMLVDYLYCPINPINVPFPIFFEDYDVSKVPDFIKNGELNIKHYRDDESNLLKVKCDHGLIVPIEEIICHQHLVFEIIQINFQVCHWYVLIMTSVKILLYYRQGLFSRFGMEEFSHLRNESWKKLPKLHKLYHSCLKIKESAKIFYEILIQKGFNSNKRWNKYIVIKRDGI
ncbi:hypothetical protein ROZALSC1DRAFT_21898 [Rozella allomycis CSF55]|uniref:Uncharacterized protein n=1 Tax=Rozella allomycis (strain CSF55) TaxID=988480 RepID=A0A4P9YKA2_ROZAC|nr:hypothetical protein ROZALSC1DRAFT_21898 [Rozella allomycis CSF55]